MEKLEEKGVNVFYHGYIFQTPLIIIINAVDINQKNGDRTENGGEKNNLLFSSLFLSFMFNFDMLIHSMVPSLVQ